MEIVTIQDQKWHKRNLGVSNFRNGDTLLEVFSVDEWFSALEQKIPAFCNYDFNEKNGTTFGKIYNWYAISDERNLAPEGSRIPRNSDWDLLLEKIGGRKNGLSLIQLSSNGDEWLEQYLIEQEETPAIETGFSALPGGYFDAADSDFVNIGGVAIFWSYEDPTIMGKYIDFDDEPKPLCIIVDNDPIIVKRSSNSAANITTCGYYVRCIVD
jgi:uncharacterized protein (TIGR02145 family)